MRCALCFHHCDLKEGQRGFCLARRNVNGKIIDENYGAITSLALDPIEKKPLKRFMPGSMILSVGGYGCNLKCPFCQNYEISYDDGQEVYGHVSPQWLVNKAVELKEEGNIGIAFTYNEPFVGYEFMYDTFRLAKEKDLYCVIVTNGTIEEEPLKKILPYVDAMNIDLKGFNQTVYQRLSGDLETVKKAITIASQACHVEVTSLIVPTLNDSLTDMEKEVQWLSSIDPSIVLHITRYFPRYHMHEPPTSLTLIESMVSMAKKYLHYVYRGNC